MIRLTSIGLALLLLFPPALAMLFPENSKTIGVALVSCFWLFAAMIGGGQSYSLRRSDAHIIALGLVIIVLLSVHAFISNSLTGEIDFNRFFGSAAILLLLLANAQFAALKLMRVPPGNLVTAASHIMLLLVMIGLAGALNAPSLGPGDNAKPVVIFSEPSHFGLALLPLLLFRCAVAGRLVQILWITVALGVAASLQSLTMVAGICALSATLLPKRVLIPMAVPVIVVALTAIDLTYYASRLDLSADSDNLSTLVFLQGWENALLNFQETHGVGVGFQQFGIAGSLGQIAKKIAELQSGQALGLLDGGTTASKLIGEFGISGILIILVFVFFALRSVLYIRRAQQLPSRLRDKRRLFFCSLITTYTFELFIRGVGYFSTGGFLAVMSLIALAHMGPDRSIVRMVRRARRPAQLAAPVS